MEDTLMLRRGVPAQGNGELVTRLAEVARALDRPSADIEETRGLLGLAA
jgi:3-keto-5-aminohexanoate cleavage enzyme